MTIYPKERARIEQEIRKRAKRRVYGKIGLMWHGMVFTLANAAMIAINMSYSPQHMWFVWPLCGWGSALLFHAFAALGTGDSTEDMIEAEVQRELARRGLT